MPGKKGRPDIAIEWRDVEIEIKVCGVEAGGEDEGFVKFFPDLDPKLMSREEVDTIRRLCRKKREKVPTFEYKLIPPSVENASESQPQVLPKLECDHCGKAFSRRSTLEQHVALHTNSNTNWEDIQDAALDELEQALAFAQMTGDSQNFPQTVKKLSQEKSSGPAANPAAVPVSTNNDGQPNMSGHKCNKCGKTFHRLSLLNRHLKLHSGIKPFACEICGWRFLQKYNLKKHMWTHSGEKPFKCSECPSSYSDMSALRNHITKQHNKEASNPSNNPPNQISQAKTVKPKLKPGEPLPCPKCNRKFTAKSHLEKHMQVHMAVSKPYKCGVCGWKFQLQHNMERHQAAHATKAAKKAKKKTSQEGSKTVPKVDSIKNETPEVAKDVASPKNVDVDLPRGDDIEEEDLSVRQPAAEVAHVMNEDDIPATDC